MFSPGGLLIPPSCPINLFWGGSRTPSVVAGLRGPRPRRPPPLVSICLFRSGGPRPVSYLCVCPEEPPECLAPLAPSGRGELCQSSVVCVLCSRLLFPYLVCFLSLLSVIISLFSSSGICLSIYVYPVYL